MSLIVTQTIVERVKSFTASNGGTVTVESYGQITYPDHSVVKRSRMEISKEISVRGVTYTAIHEYGDAIAFGASLHRAYEAVNAILERNEGPTKKAEIRCQIDDDLSLGALVVPETRLKIYRCYFLESQQDGEKLRVEIEPSEFDDLVNQVIRI